MNTTRHEPRDTTMTPAEAQAAVTAAEQTTAAVGSANALPLAAFLLSTGAALTAASLTSAADAEMGGSPMFIVRTLVCLALLIPGFVIYSLARSWSRRDTVLLFVTFGLQMAIFLTAMLVTANLRAPLYSDIAAGVIIVITTLVMFVLRRRV